MAKGLRKLIKNANRFSGNSLARRLQSRRLGTRLKVEELEDRIAPATITLEPDEYTIWDTDNDATPDVDDGWMALGANTTTGVTVSFEGTENAGEADETDDVDLNVTISLADDGANACVVHLMTNLEFESVNIVGDADVENLTLIIETGFDTTWLDASNDMVLTSSDGIADSAGTLNTDEFTGDPDTGGDLAFSDTDASDAAMGQIDFPSSDGMTVEFHIQAGLTGDLATFAGISSTDADVVFQGDETNTQASLISALSIGGSTFAGGFVLDAENVTITSDTTIGALTIGGVNTTNGGAFSAVAGTTMGAVTSSADIAADDGDISFTAQDGMGAIAVTGSIGGAGNGNTVLFNGNSDGADDGNIASISATDTIGTATDDGDDLDAAVTFTAENLGTINAQDIGVGNGGAVTFTANDPDDADAGTAAGQIGVIAGSTTLVSIGAGTGGVTFNADDGFTGGQTLLTVAGSIAAGGTVTFNTNQDANDDTGSMFAVTTGTDIGVAAGAKLVINTNGGAGDNGTQRTVGAITANGGFAGLDITADGAVGLVTVQGGDAAGNDLEIVIDTAAADADNDKPTNAVDFAGINVVATANNDSVKVTGASEISGRIWNAGANGQVIAGDGLQGTDRIILDADVIIYNGDDTLDGVIDANYSAASPFKVDFVSGGTAGNGELYAAVRNASPLFQAVLGGETFLVDASTTPVTAILTLDPDSDDNDANGLQPTIAIDDLAGSGLGAATELTVSTSGDSDFDVAQITRASNFGSRPNLKLISIEGDLYGDIGEVASEFGTVETIIIAGDASGGGINTFYGTGIKGLGTGLDADNSELGGTDEFSTLTMGPNVVVSVLNREVTEPLTLPGTLQFNWAGFGSTIFNHHIIVVEGQAIVYGIDGDSAALDEYLLSTADTADTADDVGVSGGEIDPAGVFAAGTYAMINRIALTEIDGLSTDVAVREVDGSTSGSWLEFETNVGLVNLTTQLESISVGIDDGTDAVDNWIQTYNDGDNDIDVDFDRLGGGVDGRNIAGLDPDEDVSDATAAMGNFIVRSMVEASDGGINIVVTGDSGPITLTGKSDDEDLDPDHGDLVVTDDDNAAAIAIGGNLEGAITIPGQIYNDDEDDADILIGIAVDANNDGDWSDVGETPSGSVNANIIIADAPVTQILVADDINADIVVAGSDQHPENWGLELDGDLEGVKCGGTFGALGVNVLMVAGDIDDIVADEAINSGIFVGGHDGDNYVWIEGVGINGPAVIGATNGVSEVEIGLHEVFGDEGHDNDIYVSDRGMCVQWVAGAITNSVMTLGDVYVQDDNTYLEVYTYSSDVMNIGDIFLLDDGELYIESIANIGVVVAADDVTTVPTSETLQDLISTTYDAVFGPVTNLDAAVGDDDDWIDFDGYIDAQNAGGVVAEGYIDLDDAEIQFNFGYLVSLNSDIHAHVYAGVSIGFIVACEDIDGEYISEGTLALVGPANLASELSTQFGLNGVPTWFNGGILAEVGDIGSNYDENDDLYMYDYYNNDYYEAVFTAAGVATEVQDNGGIGGGDMFWMAPAMGTIYVPAGSMSADINVAGAFGGIQVPTGECWVELNVPLEAYIGRLIAPNFHDSVGNANSSWNPDRVGLSLIDGETVVLVGAPLFGDDLTVEVTGADTIAVVDGDDIDLVGGLASGASLTVDGDLDSLSFSDRVNVTMTGLTVTQGDFAGAVNVNGSIDSIDVGGTIAPTATLVADSFETIDADDASAVTSGGTLTSTNRIDTVTNLAGDTQTLYLKGPKNVSASYTTVFGRVTSVVFAGKGTADFVSVLGAPTEKALKQMTTKHNVSGEASADVGALSVAGTEVKLDDIVVNGNIRGVTTSGTLNDLWVNGSSSDDIAAYQINRAFIADDAEDITARIMKNVTVMGDADTIGGYSLNKVKVFGDTYALYLTSNAGGPGIHAKVQNSYFNHVDYTNFDPTYADSNVRVVRTYIGGLEENAVDPTIVINNYGYGS